MKKKLYISVPTRFVRLCLSVCVHLVQILVGTIFDNIL